MLSKTISSWIEDEKNMKTEKRKTYKHGHMKLTVRFNKEASAIESP
jgi:hypothetical protein